MRSSFVAIALVLLLNLVGCAAGPGGLRPDPTLGGILEASEADRALVAALRQEVEETLREQAEGLWSRWIGEGGGEGGLYPGADERQGAVEEIHALRRVRRSSVDPEERRALLHLERFLVGELLGARTAAVDERIRGLEATRTFTDGERELSLDELGRALATEPDRERRASVAEASLSVGRLVAQEQRERDEILQETARALGHRDFAELAGLGVAGEVERLAAVAERILDETEGIFRVAFAEAARRELGVSLEELRRSDLPRLFLGATFEIRLPPEGGRRAALESFASMGLDLDGVMVDEEERAEKDPRPACFPVDPPADVRLSLAPGRSGRDWRPLLRAAGCAALASRLDAGSFEDRALGPAATAAAFGYLNEALAEDPAWLRSHTQKTRAEIEAQLAGIALQQLFVVRRAAGRFLFDRIRFAGNLQGEELDLAYRELVERAFLFPVGEAGSSRILDHRAKPFASAALFQARLLAAALEADLVRAHGERWWSEPAAGAALARLYADGIYREPAEVAALIGVDGLPLDPLLSRIASRLGPLQPPAPPLADTPAEDPSLDQEPAPKESPPVARAPTPPTASL